MGKFIMKQINKIIAFCLFLFLGNIAYSKEVKYEESRFLFGTYVKITTYSENISSTKKAIQAAFQEIERIDKKFNSKTEGSIIYQLNHSKKKEAHLDEEGIFLFRKIQKAYQLSHKKYDISISPLIQLWNFENPEKAKIPDKTSLQKVLTKVNFDKVKIEGNTLKFLSPVQEIDTGSFLKGYALARAEKILRDKGVKSAFISSISSIDLLGSKPEGKAWRIALENPENPSDILGVLSLKDKALGVSGDYQTYVEIRGEKYHHILDKTTGYPVRDKKMVVVLCKDGFDADVYSTTFFLMPISEVLEYVNKTADLEVMLVDKNMKFHMSKGFSQYFSKK